MNSYVIRRLLAVLASVTMVFALLVSAPMPSPAAAEKPPPKTPTGPVPTVTPTATPPSGIPGGFRTSGNRILAPNGAEFIIAGVNWFGFETRDAVAHGLWLEYYKFMFVRFYVFGLITIRHV